MIASGYDTKIALKSIIDDEAIGEIQQIVNENLDRNKNYLQGSSYEGVESFRLLPGHRRLIMNLHNYIREYDSIKQGQKVDTTSFSFILKSLIETAEANQNKNPKQYRYDETLMYFAMYVYLICGKACYETLSANLPIPQAVTVCKPKKKKY